LSRGRRHECLKGAPSGLGPQKLRSPKDTVGPGTAPQARWRTMGTANVRAVSPAAAAAKPQRRRRRNLGELGGKGDPLTGERLQKQCAFWVHVRDVGAYVLERLTSIWADLRKLDQKSCEGKEHQSCSRAFER